ncbi:MAG: DnaA/Hda family protein [Gemmatimonadota bacterium]
MSLELDPRLTFESFIVGTSNRLAAAAARRVADTPGSAYNPLFLYSASGLGKTHLVMAIGQHTRTIHPDLRITYDTMEHLVEGVMSAIRSGQRDAFRERIHAADLLLLDDIQFLAGRRAVQEELLRAWDGMASRGGQVVLASDRPPTEIDELDDRLLSRFSGGLIADLAPPDMETRAAIVRRKAEERGQALGDGVTEALARGAFANVRELQGALNRILAIQELEGRQVSMEEAGRLLGLALDRRGPDEFGAFLTEITGTIGQVVSPGGSEAKLAEAILRWEGEGFRTRLLEEALASPPAEAAVEAFLTGFASRVERLRTVARLIREAEGDAPELERTDVLRDPARVTEAEGLLVAVQARTRPVPRPPPGPTLAELPLPANHLAVRAGAAVAEGTGDRYVPYFLHGDRELAERVLAAVAREIAELQKGLTVAWLPGREFASELVDALGHDGVEAWRARLRRVGVLVMPDVDDLADTEGAQEELFHLFDHLRRAGARLLFSAAGPPALIDGLEDRLRGRLETGLVVELTASGSVDEEASGTEPVAAPAGLRPIADPAPREAGALVGRGGELDHWFTSREKALWDWPGHQDVPLEEGE